MPEVAGQRGQGEDRAHRRTGAAVPLQAEAEADGRRPRVREPPAERDDALDREPAGLGRALDRPLGQARLELGPALAAAREPLAILRALVEHDAHEPERQRRVGAGPRREVLVAALGRVGAQRIDRDDVRAPALRREHEAPLMEVRREQVRAPQDHELRVLEVLGIHAHGAAVGRAQRSAGGGRADRRLQARGAERGEQARAHDPALHHALGAGEVVREHRLGAVRVDRGAQPGGRRVERLVPADLLERALALGADPAQRVGHAPGPVDRVEVAVDLRAERPVREGVRAVAAQPDGAPVLDLDQPRARVRAIQRAGSAHDGSHAAESTAGRRRFRLRSRHMRWRGLEPPRPKGH